MSGPLPAPGATSFRSADVLQRFLSAHPIELAVRSQEYRDALVADFLQLTDDVASPDSLFSHQPFSLLLSHSPHAQIDAWERVLQYLQTADASRFASIHKGTPYYFLGLAAYLSRDFEKAMFYMDCALGNDLKVHGSQWIAAPSGKFVRLDHTAGDQAGKQLVELAHAQFQSATGRVAAKGGPTLSLDIFRAHFVDTAMSGPGDLRSAVTAFFSFLLEHPVRSTELSLAPQSDGTGEPFYVHLFKGALLFETLLRCSTAGRAVVSGYPEATIKHLLQNSGVHQPLGFAVTPAGLGAHSFEDVLTAINNLPATLPFDQRCVRATWGVRNTTGHSLAWPRRMTPAEYDMVFELTFGAIALAIVALLP